MIGSTRTSWIKLLFAGLLLLGLPVFIWAILTQRIELRKKAATSEPTQICWNRVIGAEVLSWPNSCKGSPRTDLVCTQIIIPLTQEERDGYMAWIKAGAPYIPGCTMPTPTPSCTMPPACAYYNPPCAYAQQGVTYCQITPTPKQRCTSNVDCPSGYICSATPPGGCPTTTINGVTQTTACATVPQCWPVNPTKTPTPTPGCYYKQVQCFQAPCPPILICPTITPTPTLTCGRGTPKVILIPNNQSGNPGQTLTYTASITNTDTQGCSPSLFSLSNQVDANFTAQHATTITIPPLSTANVSVTVTSPATDPYSDTRSLPITFRATHTVSNLSGSANAAYTLIKPAPQQIQFWVRLAGVSGGEATGAKINVKFYLKDGSILQMSPLTLTYTPSAGGPAGTYTAYATIVNPLPQNTQFRVQIKGEKHLAVKFCKDSGQTVPCADTDYISMPGSGGTYILNFTGIPLPPGDLNQDGKVNTDDLKLITDLFKKPSSQLTAADLKSADVDYSGTIDAYDLNLVLQTLETRYDEQ